MLNDASMLQLLLAKGFPFDSRDSDGDTAIMLAIDNEFVECETILRAAAEAEEAGAEAEAGPAGEIKAKIEAQVETEKAEVGG